MNHTTETAAERETRELVAQTLRTFGFEHDAEAGAHLKLPAFVERAIWAVKGTGTAPALVDRLRRIHRMLTHTTLIERDTKCTVYVGGTMGVTKLETRSVLVEAGPYAQHARGIFLTFTEKGKRKPRAVAYGSHPYVLVLEGWGHPAPDGMWDESKTRESGAVTTKVGRYSACDARWQTDFDAKIEAYASQTGARVLLDERHTKGAAQ